MTDMLIEENKKLKQALKFYTRFDKVECSNYDCDEVFPDNGDTAARALIRSNE